MDPNLESESMSITRSGSRRVLIWGQGEGSQFMVDSRVGLQEQGLSWSQGNQNEAVLESWVRVYF